MRICVRIPDTIWNTLACENLAEGIALSHKLLRFAGVAGKGGEIHLQGLMEVVKVRVAIRLIEADGWVQVRQRGSHRQFKHPLKPGLVTVPGKPSRDLPRGLEKSIMRQAGLR